jgi:acetate kinase
MARMAARLRSNDQGGRIAGVGHRVVHGGPHFSGTSVVTPEVLADPPGSFS